MENNQKIKLTLVHLLDFKNTGSGENGLSTETNSYQSQNSFYFIFTQPTNILFWSFNLISELPGLSFSSNLNVLLKSLRSQLVNV